MSSRYVEKLKRFLCCTWQLPYKAASHVYLSYVCFSLISCLVLLQKRYYNDKATIKKVLSISSGTFAFFLLMFLLTFVLSQMRRYVSNNITKLRLTLYLRMVHYDHYIVKTCVLAGFIVASFWVDVANHFVVHSFYGHAAQVGAGLFIFIQVLLIIDFAYSAGENLRQVWPFFYFILCAILYLAAIAIIVAMYFWFYNPHSPGDGCQLNLFFITFLGTQIFVLFIFILFSKHGRFLTASLITLYTTFVLWSALFSEPSNNSFDCSNIPKSSSQKWQLVIGLVVVCITLVLNSNTSATSSDRFFPSVDRSNVSPVTRNSIVISLEENEDGSRSPRHSYQSSDDEYSFPFFHFVMGLACMYIIMQITNWLQGTDSNQKQGQNSGWLSVWVKVVSSWVCMVIYYWTILAPYIFRNRDFGIELTHNKNQIVPLPQQTGNVPAVVASAV